MSAASEYSSDSGPDQSAEPYLAPAEVLYGGANIWTHAELVLLKQLLPEYIRRKKQERIDFITNTAFQKVEELWGDRYRYPSLKDSAIRAQWKKKKKQVRTWFQNHSKGSSKVKDLGFKQNITFSSVMDILHKEAIMNECDLLADGAGRGTPDWFRFYRKAAQTVRLQLDELEKKEILEKMETYKSAGYPPEYQAIHAFRYGRAMIKKADEHRFKTMGMRSLTFECHYNSAGKIVFGISINFFRALHNPHLNGLAKHIYYLLDAPFAILVGHAIHNYILWPLRTMTTQPDSPNGNHLIGMPE
ncbi:hypothetical protein CPC08DRAFT_728851 [Agrocybe pediades]|nr:hypothetical protein CPC08DRAFT_728851 [Agrocybe pediades]